ncbi:protein of unknown function DUF1614 [Pirellula staleyi DSM 6068]|uniref:DUF1614 domain-containing protein n=1 Tax=Pirellula staleyi (strain ATCC 27377 / DSM 6068 / ICPB 4128) TaxID=530564 RepID=D2R859_PIRSD|nr:DUF1614 domain-containing protein [Pirellula staleyi]ADB15676.1 protein of unknown function DUF1614 [Pirellula staleyi DSM 6068]
MQPDRTPPVVSILPQVGCVLLIFLIIGLGFLSLVFGGMQTALEKLHFSPSGATLTIFAIIVGSMINLPLMRVRRDVEQATASGIWQVRQQWVPMMRRSQLETIIAVNVGGCIIPLLIAVFEGTYVRSHSSQAILALVISAAINIAICHAIARPVPGVGIVMPAFLPPLAAIGCAWILLWSDRYDDVRAPVAFIAGVLGPLVGADLLNFRHFERISAGVLSIGGAGSFDAIVISGLLAAFFV